MKLKLISEVVHMNSDQFFGHLGKIKSAAMPDRTRRYEKKEVKYTNPSPDPKKSCQSCENFSKGACKYVEGDIAPTAVCKFYQLNPQQQPKQPQQP
ncbi:hypothetical protein N9045_00870 [bacterium]|nr:hypothetical protein [bacterium]